MRPRLTFHALVATGLLLLLLPMNAASARARGAATGLVWSSTTFVIRGHGWGHGVGLSQYGAYGYAQHGYSYDRIVTHYFPGTELASAPSKTIRVLLAGGLKKLAISSADPFTVEDGDGIDHDVSKLSLKLDSSLTLELDGEGSTSLAGPLLFDAGPSPLVFAGRAYRGKLMVEVVGDRLRLINYVGLEPYLYGVVPCESPHDWPADALQAQAVVARSYALVSIKPGSAYDVYADTRSQVYLGRSHEYPESTAAVNATAGEAVYYQDEIARTFFFSTSGGRTAAIQDAWPKAQPIPYLVSVKDPYDKVSPYHNWGPVTVSARKLARALGIPGPVSNLTTTVNGSKRVSVATLTGAADTTYEVPGDTVRDALGLRSNWFRVSVLALQRPTKPLRRGRSVRLAGRARGAVSPRLEMRPRGGAWRTLKRLSPGRAGLFRVRLRPRVTSYYRIRDGAAKTASIRIAVTRR
jgi:stage II sporulation protein D